MLKVSWENPRIIKVSNFYFFHDKWVGQHSKLYDWKLLEICLTNYISWDRRNVMYRRLPSDIKWFNITNGSERDIFNPHFFSDQCTASLLTVSSRSQYGYVIISECVVALISHIFGLVAILLSKKDNQSLSLLTVSVTESFLLIVTLVSIIQKQINPIW